MTEHEAIEMMQGYQITDAVDRAEYDAFQMAINALEEIQQYRDIGTVEEYKKSADVRKQITEIVNRQLIAGKNNYKEVYNCFYEIVDVVQNNY